MNKTELVAAIAEQAEISKKDAEAALKPAKASVNVKVGDIIEIQFGTSSVRVEVLDVQETVRKDDAKELYRYL